MPTDSAALAVTGRTPRGPAALLMACHPAPAFLVTAVAVALAVSWGRDAGGVAAVGLGTLAGQLSVGWCNDRVDLARDRAAGRRDKPLVNGGLRPGAVTAAALVALAMCVPLSLAAGPAAGAAHLAGVGAAWGYDLWLKRTVLSPVPYAVAFGLLPAFVSLGLPGQPWPPVWVSAAGALLGVGAHAANVLPDIRADLAAGVRGLPQRLGARRSRAVTAGALLAASAALLVGPPGPLGPAGWGALALTGALSVAAGALPRADGAGRTPFLAALTVAAVDVVLLVLRGSPLG
jgi:4-hydroxybenzoate polyprenyltransferase